MREDAKSTAFLMPTPRKASINGLALCDGDMVGILNCGDWYAPETLQLAASAFTPSGIVHGHMVTWVEGKPAHEVFPNPQAIYREMSVNFATCFFCAPLMRTPPYFDHTFDYATDYDLFALFEARGNIAGSSARSCPHALGRSFCAHWVAALRDVSKSRVRAWMCSMERVWLPRVSCFQGLYAPFAGKSGLAESD